MSTNASVRENTVTTLYAGALGRVDYISCSGQRRERGKKESSKHFHIVLPLSGSFVWHPANEDVFADATKALFVSGGEDFAISHPVGGDRSLVIWPSAMVMDEFTRRAPQAWSRHPAFATRVRDTSCDIQLLERVLIAACSASDNDLAVEESLAHLIEFLIDEPAQNGGGFTGAKQTLARAKSVLHARSGKRVSLVEVARAVGVSPIYLTQLFRAAEGMPLYQYALNLRLTAALDVLAESDDITGLAMDLGFSSHSHFTAAFRKRFGLPPSQVREKLRQAQRAAPASAPSTHRRDVRPLCVLRGGTADYQWS